MLYIKCNNKNDIFICSLAVNKSYADIADFCTPEPGVKVLCVDINSKFYTPQPSELKFIVSPGRSNSKGHWEAVQNIEYIYKIIGTNKFEYYLSIKNPNHGINVIKGSYWSDTELFYNIVRIVEQIVINNFAYQDYVIKYSPTVSIIMKHKKELDNINAKLASKKHLREMLSEMLKVEKVKLEKIKERKESLLPQEYKDYIAKTYQVKKVYNEEKTCTPIGYMVKGIRYQMQYIFF